MSWKMVKLGEICDIINGNAFKSDDFVDEGIPLIRISNIGNTMVTINDNTAFLPQIRLKEFPKFEVKKGDILIALSGATTGKYGIYNLSEPALLNQRIGLIRVNNVENLCKEYLFYYLNILKSDIERMAQGAAQPNISTNEIANFEIPLPPLSIQQRIATILDKADALRRKDQVLLKKYDELAQAIFMDMFGDPVRNEMGWEVKKLGDSIDFITSGSRGWAQYYTEKGDLFLRINNVGYNEMKMSDLVYVNAPNSAETKRIEVKEGDILLSITADLGRTCVIPKNFPKAFINQHLALLRIKKEYNPFFVSQIFASDYGKNQFKRLNKGGVKAGLNFDDIKSLEFLNPPKELQSKYLSIYEVFNKARLTVLKNKINSETLFHSLLQQAFKGELD